jgi:antitoxin component YwqK of YwqJK toxin-antitoxin module
MIILLPVACSPDSDRGTAQPPAAPSEAGLTNPAITRGAPAPDEVPAEVPFQNLGWDGSRYTYKAPGASVANPYTGITTDHFKSGGLKARYGLHEGVYHGLVEEWYENGQQKTKTSYQHGKHEGDNFYWNQDGTLQAHKVWKDDILVKETPHPPP